MFWGTATTDRRKFIRNSVLWVGSTVPVFTRSSSAPGATPQQTILIIRHAERPVSGGDRGVDPSGAADDESITPRGWQRAGVWADLLAASLNQVSALPTPQTIFAPLPPTPSELGTGRVGSNRPLNTVTPLAGKLAINIDLRFKEGQENDLVTTIAQIAGVTLVCWEHEEITTIARTLAPDAQNIPSEWPDDCFNVVFRFDRPSAASPWVFQQIVPLMLGGDKPTQL
jgi:hypothetical protein